MAEKLTLADCYKYNKSTITSEPTIHVFSNVKVLIEYAHENMLTIQEIIDFNNLKLILRDISQLTDDEKKYISKEYLISGLYSERTFKEIESLLLNTWRNKKVELINYLREKNIMIEKPDWFEIGKAVKNENNNKIIQNTDKGN